MLSAPLSPSLPKLWRPTPPIAGSLRGRCTIERALAQPLRAQAEIHQHEVHPQPHSRLSQPPQAACPHGPTTAPSAGFGAFVLGAPHIIVKAQA